MDKNYIKKQALRMREYIDTPHLYLDAVYRLLSNANAIPVAYENSDNLTEADIKKAETIAAKALKDGINTILKAEINHLARELALLSGYVFPERYDFFSSLNPRAQHFESLAERAFEVIQGVTLDA
ncbi:hypothetical protein [Okeania sp. SIO2B3]|uniref:hypothetical protein n=1 Tax=Okeania sp. SIO2B3 TaxID=2607784 RepID=UPI0013C252F9|nr:hypothetical protein [Okeania sp. SIO2B3]NET46496.1 hypothetical protein [Okeania sp. SIO2B3]